MSDEWLAYTLVVLAFVAGCFAGAGLVAWYTQRGVRAARAWMEREKAARLVALRAVNQRTRAPEGNGQSTIADSRAGRDK